MKKILSIIIILVSFYSYAQNDQRIQNIKHQLEILSTETIGLTENVKTEISLCLISY